MTHKEKLEKEKQQRKNDWLDVFAEAVHTGWLAGMITRGYMFGPERDDELLTYPHVLLWQDLAEGDKVSSYWAAEGVLDSLVSADVISENYLLYSRT